MIGKSLRSKRMVLLWAVGLICARVSLADVVDDFSKDGWRAANPKAPARVEASRGRLVITDLPGRRRAHGLRIGHRARVHSLLPSHRRRSAGQRVGTLCRRQGGSGA